MLNSSRCRWRLFGKQLLALKSTRVGMNQNFSFRNGKSMLTHFLRFQMIQILLSLEGLGPIMSFPISIQAHHDVADDHVNSCYCHYFAYIKQSFCSFLFSFSHCPIPSLFLVLLLLCLLALYFAFACILIVLPFLSSFLFLHHLLRSLCYYC